MDCSEVQKRSNSDSRDGYQLAAKKQKTRNEIWNFADPPKCIFDKLKIPRIPEGHQQRIPVLNTPSNVTFQSSIPPPFPLLENNLVTRDDPVTKAVIDNLTGKFNKPSQKLQHFRCKECNLFLTSQTSLDTHLAGARHAKRLRELELSSVIDDLKNEKVSKISDSEFKCKLCNVLAGSLVQIKSHIDGSKHKKKIKVYQEKKSAEHKSFTEKISTSDPNVVTKITASAGDLTSLENMIVDSTSTDNSTTKKNKPTVTFFCSICGLNMNSQLQFDEHTNSKKHISKASKLCNMQVDSTTSVSGGTLPS